jgi:hypothetical protein
MFTNNKLQHIIVAAVGALIFSTASIGAAVGPAQPLHVGTVAQLVS